MAILYALTAGATVRAEALELSQTAPTLVHEISTTPSGLLNLINRNNITRDAPRAAISGNGSVLAFTGVNTSGQFFPYYATDLIPAAPDRTRSR